ncbi:MAG: hydrogenase expression/formation protein HypE [Candidatus Woesearchaeota archaeon]
MNIGLHHGAGGKEMHELVARIRKVLGSTGKWFNSDGDSAFFGDIAFTTDSYTISPLFFPGGDIGKLAVCGTINDLVVSGAEPVGISLGLVIEEGFSEERLMFIIGSIHKEAEKANVPVVTGDTKVMPKKTLDGLIINTSGIGRIKRQLTKKLEIGDQIIVTGNIAEHGAALLAERFKFESKIKSDCKNIMPELMSVIHLIKQAKDPTRGGISACIAELATKNKVGVLINEKAVPISKPVSAICKLLGVDPFSLACEGRAILVCKKNNARLVLKKLKQFNKTAAVIGEITKNDLIINTPVGQRFLEMPTGEVVPRIC